MNPRRKQLVLLAFKQLDKTGDGFVTYEDLQQVYDVTHNPDFKSGLKSKKEILEDFMKQWETNKVDGRVTPDEFIDYYNDVSASIDDDDYFELMIRNAWHLAGGQGAYENTTITRVLKTNPDGT